MAIGLSVVSVVKLMVDSRGEKKTGPLISRGPVNMRAVVRSQFMSGAHAKHGNAGPHSRKRPPACTHADLRRAHRDHRVDSAPGKRKRPDSGAAGRMTLFSTLFSVAAIGGKSPRSSIVGG